MNLIPHVQVSTGDLSSGPSDTISRKVLVVFRVWLIQIEVQRHGTIFGLRQFKYVCLSGHMSSEAQREHSAFLYSGASCTSTST